MEKDDEYYFPVAIVGMACKLPGANNVREYRKVLLEQLRTYKRIPDDKWSHKEWHCSPDLYKRGYANNDVIGAVDGFNSFDHKYFNVSPKEALSMDWQQFQLMEMTQCALDDAGITQEEIPQSTAVYMAMNMGEMTIPIAEQSCLVGPYTLTGGGRSVAANRISFYYDLLGPSVGVEAGCSSFLASVHYGLLSLWNNECSAVIAGAANCIRCPNLHINHCQVGYLSQVGEARPFDRRADGKVRSEACGVVVMKPLHDAIAHGDHVHCVIRASVSGYHGNSLDMASGNVDAVSEVMMKVYDWNGISPEHVDYIETSASGYPSDDIYEAEVLSRVFQMRKKPIKIGSYKANIGHAEIASGVASLFKCLLMLENREFYAQANFDDINPKIPTKKWKLEIQREYEKYEDRKLMFVGLSSISSTGQVLHMLLEEYQNKEPQVIAEDLAGWHFGVSGENGRNVVVVLTAKSNAALRQMAKEWLQYANSKDDAQIVASCLASRRNHYKNRLIIIANSGDDFKEKIRDFLEGNPNAAVTEGTAPANINPTKICFVFPGQGQQQQDMGRSLYVREPVYKDVVDRCDAIWKNESGFSFLDEFQIFTPRSTSANQPDIDDITICQIAIVVHQMALSSLIRYWGISPVMVVGHSLGEVAAAYVAGTMTLEECVVSIYHRTATLAKMSGRGAMAAARFSPNEGDRFASGYDNLYVACYNSVDSVTLAGDVDAISRLADKNPKKFKLIRVKAAFHTEMMRPMREEYFDRMRGKYVPKLSNDVTIYSTVTKDAYPGPHGVEYWWTSLEQPVYFVHAIKSIFRDHGGNVVFVEITSAPTLLSCIRQTANSLCVNPEGYVTCGIRGGEDWIAAVKGLVQLYFMGFPVNWNNITRNCARYVQIPEYPFQRSKYNLESELYRDRRLGTEDKSYRGRQGEIDVQMHPFLVDCRFKGKAIMPASGWIEYLIEMSDETERPCLRDVNIYNTPNVPDMNILGEYEKLYVEAMIQDDKVILQANEQAWNISSVQPRGLYAAGILTTLCVEDLPTKISLDAIRNRCSTCIDSSRVYGILSDIGWQYGDCFKAVTEVRIGEREAVGSLAAEINRHERLKTITIDGALQIAQVVFGDSKAPHEISRVDEVQLRCEALPLNEPFSVYVKLIDRSIEGFAVNIYITDSEGNILACLRRCCFVRRCHQRQQPIVSDVYSESVTSQSKASSETTTDKVTQVQELLVQFLSNQLMLSRSQFDGHVPLRHYGVNSIIAEELRRWLKAEFDLEITRDVFANNITLIELAERISCKRVA